MKGFPTKSIALPSAAPKPPPTRSARVNGAVSGSNATAPRAAPALAAPLAPSMTH